MTWTIPDIILPEVPQDADREAIFACLAAFNQSRAGLSGFQQLAILLQDPSTSDTVGGLWGYSLYDWLFIELLFVPDPFRGLKLGTKLLHMAERIGTERGCVGVWLDTFGFQARGFYERNGFEVFGALDDHPRGTKRFFMRKSFAMSPNGSGSP